MSTRLWILAAAMTAAIGTGCCHDQCGYYNSTTYDPCTGLVPNKHGCLDKFKSIFDKDDCGCKKAKKSKCGCHHDDMMFDHGTPIYGEMGADCPCNSHHGTPTFSPSGPMETYVSPEEFDQIPGTPMPSKAAKPVPAPAAKPMPAPAAEPEPLPAETSTTIPPASYVVPAPLDGPSVPVLKAYEE